MSESAFLIIFIAGKTIVNVVGHVETDMVPPCCSITVLQYANPRPVPVVLVEYRRPLA